MYFIIYSLLTSSVVTIAKSFNISFVNQTVTVNKRTATKFLLVIEKWIGFLWLYTSPIAGSSECGKYPSGSRKGEKCLTS
jgi:hypothetical protein